MLGALPNNHAAQQTIDQATGTLGDIDDLDTAAALESTTNSKLALLICAVTAARTFAKDYDVSPTFVAGHSVGAFAAT